MDEIAGSSLHVQSCPGVQTHLLRKLSGQHHAIALIGTDVHPASKNEAPLVVPGPTQVHWTGGSGAAQEVALREHPVMHSAPPSLAPPASCPATASTPTGPPSEFKLAAPSPGASNTARSVVASPIAATPASEMAVGVVPSQFTHTSPWQVQVWPQPSDVSDRACAASTTVTAAKTCTVRPKARHFSPLRSLVKGSGSTRRR